MLGSEWNFLVAARCVSVQLNWITSPLSGSSLLALVVSLSHAVREVEGDKQGTGEAQSSLPQGSQETSHVSNCSVYLGS